jgi:CheY-like chemotaxis protein
MLLTSMELGGPLFGEPATVRPLIESVMSHQAVRRRQPPRRSRVPPARHEAEPRRPLASTDDPSVEPRQWPRSLSRPRILVIEDDPYAREALALLLDYYGYDVIAASNGSDGLALVTDAKPDLVVTDWRMPGLSGRALCVALRARRDTMPIVVVTSADEVFSRDQPVNARLRKPVDPPLLNRVISDELRAQQRDSP